MHRKHYPGVDGSSPPPKTPSSSILVT